MDDGKDLRPGSGGVGDRAAVDVALGDDTGEPVARRVLRTGALGTGFGNRGVGDPWSDRHTEALALGSGAQPVGVRMRWLAWI